MNAETHAGSTRYAHQLVLQWGRVLMNAETTPTPGGKWKVDPLQWGRVLMNAETRSAVGHRSPFLSSFNGAAFS